MVDAFFTHFNTHYPIIHEPTFRAQYSEVIERPNGESWKVLAYVVAAIGVFCTAAGAEILDLNLFAQAKPLMHRDILESGNLTLVQALTLMSNYLQKRDKPNSGYNYVGVAVRMAMGIGLHKEFQGWAIRPLKMEIRRRVWWCLCVFDIGATITFGRPIVWPGGGVDVALPMNVHDYVSLHEIYASGAGHD
jgi:transcriptional regulatory protein GAL4